MTPADQGRPQTVSREEILAIIRRTAQANGGIPLGHDRLTKLGIPPDVWGRYWSRLSAAQREAGVVPNQRNPIRPEEDALSHLVHLIRELKAIPTSRDRVVKRNQDPTFPSEKVWKRLGPNSRLLARLVRYAETHPGHEDVLALCAHRHPAEELATSKIPTVAFGSVYLQRFAAKRINSEWFDLDAADVAAFKRWKRLR